MRYVLTTVFLLGVACSGGGESVPAAPFDAAAFPVSGDFYVPPDALDQFESGDPIWVEPLAAPSGVTAWKVLYRSEAITGDPIAVSGWVAVSPAPGPHRILVVAHGTTGLGDDCAPTRRGGTPPAHFAEHLDAGWTVAFTDYQGLGTPGLHHYLVAEAEARALLDVAKAARQIDHQAGGDVALFGFSQGGHAVLAAAEQAPELAPQLRPPTPATSA